MFSCPFMILMKWQYNDLSIFSSWYLPFLILPYSSVQKKIKHFKLDVIGY